MIRLVLFLTIFFNSSIFSYEKSGSFVVRAHPQYYKVLSPTKVDKKIGLVIQNKTHSKIVGKLWSTAKGDIRFLSIEPGTTKSFEFNFRKSDEYFFIPMSPPFQRVRLKVGEKSYEVPAQRKD